MNDSTFSLPYAMKITQWENAKGLLRGLVKMQGSYYGSGKNQNTKFEELGTVVETLITYVEENALQE